MWIVGTANTHSLVGCRVRDSVGGLRGGSRKIFRQMAYVAEKYSMTLENPHVKILKSFYGNGVFVEGYSFCDVFSSGYLFFSNFVCIIVCVKNN